MQKRSLILIVVIAIFFTLSLNVSAAEWTTSKTEDEMSGEKIWYAFSPATKATEEMDFPYKGVEATLSIGYDGNEKWVYIGFTETPNISKSETQDGYNLITTRIKWDDNDPEEVKLTQEWGSKFIHFRNDEDIVSKIVNANTVLVELNWYSEGNVYFRFSLEGSAKAVEELNNAFDN